jgi:presenilin-like A22 family membrane protease
VCWETRPIVTCASSRVWSDRLLLRAIILGAASVGVLLGMLLMLYMVIRSDAAKALATPQ